MPYVEHEGRMLSSEALESMAPAQSILPIHIVNKTCNWRND